MITRILLAALLLAPSAFAAEQAPKSDICFSAPSQWARTIDANQHLLSLIPERGSALTFAESADYVGSAEAWKQELWDGLQQSLKLKTEPMTGDGGAFTTTSARFEKADGTPIWIRLYSAVQNGRGESVMFLCSSEALYQKHLSAVDQLMGGVTFAATVNVAVAPQPPAAPPPASGELNVPVPPGWSAQTDPASHAIYMKPPNAASARDAALVVFPAMDFNGTAEQFRQENEVRAAGQGKLVEPVRQGQLGIFLMSGVHVATPQGAELIMAVYTARWGTRAQLVLWAADRKDLFAGNLAGVVGVLKQVAAPEGDATPWAGATDTGAAPAAATAGPVETPPAAPPGNAGGGGADAAETMPVLEYADPPNFWRAGAGGKSYAEYQGSDINFTLCIYPFREFNGDIRQTFQQSMLRDWIDVMYREEGVAGQPRVVANNLVGADTVIDAHFNDARSQEHHRLVIISGQWAAIVDMIAPTAFAYQKGFPSVLECLKTMHVGRKQAPPSLAKGPGPAGAQLAGLFQGMKGKFTVNLQLGVGYGGSKLALHYYLLSADGRVYRCYDFPPGGSEAAARNFDFDSAARQDPQNSGRYAVRGNELYLKFNGPNVDEITTIVSDPNTLQLDGVTYQRK